LAWFEKYVMRRVCDSPENSEIGQKFPRLPTGL
jgi:hypothetical protein